MRVTALAGPSVGKTPSAARRIGSGTFSVNEGTTSNGSTPSTGLRTIASVDALIALQGVEDPAERRKRAVRQGRNALDVLEGIKLGLLDGSLDAAAVGRLKSAAESLKQASGDTGLDSVLAEIELRVEVELAKAQRN